MYYHNRTSGAKDAETPAETIIYSSSLLRPAIEHMDKETKKTVTSQQSDIGSFDNFIEKKK